MRLPFFSIIIPTRNRYETLLYAIRTVLNQDYESFELIISDNSDPINYHKLELINEYIVDQRIQYYRTPSVLSMSDNWEFAVSKSKGEFVIIFGDDDGLVVGSLNCIYNIIQKTKTDLVSWARVEYSWPDRKPQQYSNRMVLPYMAKTGVVNGKKYIKKVISHKADYRYLPMFYNSAVSKYLIKLLKEKTGRVFSAVSPDIYTGYAFAYLMKKYISIKDPLSINGVSSKSNGAAHLNEDELAKSDYWNTLKTSEIKWPQSIPEIYTAYLGIIEPFIQLTKFFPELNKYISRKKMYKIIIDTLSSNSQQSLENKLEKILDSAKNDKRLYRWLMQYVHKVDPKIISNNISEYEKKVGFDGSYLVLDASKFGLVNVYDVSIFVHNLFGNLKETDYFKPIYLPLIKRIKRAIAIILRGV